MSITAHNLNQWIGELLGKIPILMPLVEKIITFTYYYSWEWALLLQQLPREVLWGCCRFVLCTVMSAGQCSFLSLTLLLSLEITPSRVPKASPNPRKEHNCWAEGENVQEGESWLWFIIRSLEREANQWIRMSLVDPSEKLYLHSQDLKITDDFHRTFSQTFGCPLNIFLYLIENLR